MLMLLLQRFRSESFRKAKSQINKMKLRLAIFGDFAMVALHSIILVE